jgi:NAD(P)-dependent dehydrogenase (short-subunit alcohol dehydrogenase family)
MPGAGRPRTSAPRSCATPHAWRSSRTRRGTAVSSRPAPPGERRYATEDELRAEAQRLPFRRLGRPHEIGRVVAFLASDAASFVSGAVLRADGAQIAALGG